MYTLVYIHNLAWKSGACHIVEIHCDSFDFANCDLKLAHILGPYVNIANETFTEMSLEYKHLLCSYLLLWIATTIKTITNISSHNKFLLAIW